MARISLISKMDMGSRYYRMQRAGSLLERLRSRSEALRLVPRHAWFVHSNEHGRHAPQFAVIEKRQPGPLKCVDMAQGRARLRFALFSSALFIGSAFGQTDRCI